MACLTKAGLDRPRSSASRIITSAAGPERSITIRFCSDIPLHLIVYRGILYRYFPLSSLSGARAITLHPNLTPVISAGMQPRVAWPANRAQEPCWGKPPIIVGCMMDGRSWGGQARLADTTRPPHDTLSRTRPLRTVLAPFCVRAVRHYPRYNRTRRGVNRQSI